MADKLQRKGWKMRGGWGSNFLSRHGGIATNRKRLTVVRDEEANGLVIRQRGADSKMQNYLKRCLLAIMGARLVLRLVLYCTRRTGESTLELVAGLLVVVAGVFGSERFLSRLAFLTVTINDSEITVQNSLFSRNYKVRDMDVIRMTDRSLIAVDRQSRQRHVFLLGLQSHEAQSIIRQIEIHPGLKQIQSKVVDASHNTPESLSLSVRLFAAFPYS